MLSRLKIRPLLAIILAASIALAGSALLSGCDVVAVSPEPTASPTRTATATRTPTVTPSATPTMKPTPTPTPLPFDIDLKASSLRLVQGEPLALLVTSSRTCSMSGNVGERTLRFSQVATDTYLAMIGFDAGTTPGEQTLQISARADNGQRTAFATSLTITEAGFPSEQLTFEPDTAQLLDPELREKERKKLQTIYSTFSSRPLWRASFQWPHSGPITSPYGTYRVYQGQYKGFHAGIDIDGETGDLIHASAAGNVVLAEGLAVRGKSVILDHGLGVYSIYSHLDEIDVAVGDQIEQGDRLGKMGSTGLSTGSHLHWEMRVQDSSVDPRFWTNPDFMALRYGGTTP